MSEDLIDWKPMEEDFESLSFNSYGSGQTAALLPLQLFPPSVSHKPKRHPKTSLKLYMDGFPSDLTEEGLKNFLKRIGCQFLRIQIIRRQDLNKRNRPFGFIDFESTKAAQNGIQLIKSQKLFKLFVCFTATESELKERNGIKDQEFKEFVEQFCEQNNEVRDQTTK